MDLARGFMTPTIELEILMCIYLYGCEVLIIIHALSVGAEAGGLLGALMHYVTPT